MALVPEEDIFKTEERKVNTSPLVKSLANMDLEIKAILEDTSMPPDRKIQLYDSIMSRYRNILNQYRSKIPYVRVLPKPKRKKRKRPRRPAFATPIGSAVLPTPLPPPVEVPEEEEEDEEPLLIPTPPTDTPLQLPTPPQATPFLLVKKKGKRILSSPIVEVIPQQVYIRICPCRLRYSFGQIPTCHGISGFRFEARAGEKKSSVGDAHRVFLRVVEIQRRKVRQYSKICVTLLFKTSKLSESEIPVQFVYPKKVYLSLHPFVPGHCLQENTLYLRISVEEWM